MPTYPIKPSRRRRIAAALVALLLLVPVVGFSQSGGPAAKTPMEESDITRPESRPERLTKIHHTLERQITEMNAMNARCDLLMIGDSLTAGFPKAEESWRILTDGLAAYNAGIGGETVQGMLYRLEKWPPDLNPKTVTLLCGANNPQDAPQDVAAGTIRVLDAIRAKWPSSDIILVSLTPRGTGPQDALCENVRATNEITSKAAVERGMRYLDLWQVFTHRGGEDGYVGVKFDPKDKLHLAPDGYRLWADALAPLLKKQ